MGITKTYMDFSMLAQASYSDLLMGVPSIAKLTEANKAEFTQQQAIDFAARYIVDYSYTDAATGFSATLFNEVDTTGKVINKIISVRGTELAFSFDSMKDLLSDVALGISGYTYGQQVALEAFYHRLITPVSEGGLGKLSPTEKFDMTGHSLGGFDVQVFTLKHPDVINHAYTYNAPGLGGMTAEKLSLFGILPDQINNSKITNVIASDSLTLIAGFGVMAGEIVEIPGDWHSIADVTQTLTQMNASGTLPKTLTYSSLNASQKSTLAIVSDWIMSKLDQAGDMIEGVFQSLENTVAKVHDSLFAPSVTVSAKIIDGNLSFSDGKQTIVSSITTQNTNITHTIDTYSPTGQKTSSTVSAYSSAGDLLGRTSSQPLPNDFITVPSASSPSSMAATLEQTLASNDVFVKDALQIAAFVGLGNPEDSIWIDTLHMDPSKFSSDGVYLGTATYGIPNLTMSDNLPLNSILLNDLVTRGNAGLILSNVTSNDSGLWSSLINGIGSGLSALGGLLVEGWELFTANVTLNGLDLGNLNSINNFVITNGFYIETYKPVILDLDGDGVEMTSLSSSRAWFDSTGDVTLHKSGWVAINHQNFNNTRSVT